MILLPLLLTLMTLTPTQTRELLSHSKSILEWDANVEAVKILNGGSLPPFWQKEIIDSQYFDGLQLSWDTRLRDRANLVAPTTERW